MSAKTQLDWADSDSKQDQLCRAIEISWKVAHEAKDRYGLNQYQHCWDVIYNKLTGIMDWIIYTENTESPEILEFMLDIEFLYTMAHNYRYSLV